MKRIVAAALAVILCMNMSACGQETEAGVSDGKTSVVLNVVTSFAGNDGNAQNYRAACSAWQRESGYMINDMSATADDSFKERVAMDFATGSEPDVLFFFTGADASAFIDAGKVVSLEEIRHEYPDYASNQDEEKLAASLVDGNVYAVPVNGYWEAMYVNKEVLEAVGVEVPGRDYTWEQFLSDCEKIRLGGYIPVAAALGDIPNYWWEFAIFNHTGPDSHLNIPRDVEDVQGQAWVAGMEDIKLLYERGYFPANTTSAKDAETLSVFMHGGAAFLVDGSWRLNGIVQACQSNPDDPSTLDVEKLEQFTVTYVPGTEQRAATDLIGGVSMGYYITRRAWNDPQKRQAAVEFITYMTSDKVVADFAQYTTSTLLNIEEPNRDEYNSLQMDAMELLEGATSFTGAVQDFFDGECRSTTFAGMTQIVTGEVSASKAVSDGLQIYNTQ